MAVTVTVQVQVQLHVHVHVHVQARWFSLEENELQQAEGFMTSVRCSQEPEKESFRTRQEIEIRELEKYPNTQIPKYPRQLFGACA